MGCAGDYTAWGEINLTLTFLQLLNKGPLSDNQMTNFEDILNIGRVSILLRPKQLFGKLGVFFVKVPLIPPEHL